VTKYGYSRRHRAVEIVCISAVFLLLIAFALQIARTVQTPSGWVNLVITGLVGYVATDLFSGVVHWAGDTLGDERLPLVGSGFIRPFREHHVDPRGITRHDFVETNGNNCIVILGPLAIAFVVMPAAEGFWFFTASFVAFMSLFTVATNQFHKWAHAEQPPRIARLLQRLGLVLPPQHHDVHHTRPHDSQYCITVGWMNPVLNWMRFFRVAEWLIARVRPSLLHLDERIRVAAERAALQAEAAAAGTAAAAAAAPVERPARSR
jgi:plasmanylethanolamine desaturase